MNTAITPETVYGVLRGVRDPELDHDIVELGLVQEVEIDEGVVYLEIHPTSPHCPYGPEIVRRVKSAVAAMDGVRGVEVSWAGLATEE